MRGWWRKLVKWFNPPPEVSPYGVWVRFPWQTVLVDPEEYRRCPARCETWSESVPGAWAVSDGCYTDVAAGCLVATGTGGVR